MFLMIYSPIRYTSFTGLTAALQLPALQRGLHQLAPSTLQQRYWLLAG